MLRNGFLALALVSVSLVATAAGDAKRGRVLSSTCMGCHGIPDYANAYPTYRVPLLGGQSPEYVVAALKGYKTKERPHGTMHAQASSMTDQDMEDIAAFITKAPVRP